MYVGGMMKICQRCGYNIIIGISRLSYNQRTALGENICKCISPTTENVSEIQILKAQLAEAQSYKADAERYKWLAEHVDFGDWFCGYSAIKDSYGQTDDFYMDDKKHMDEAIDQAMKEGF